MNNSSGLFKTFINILKNCPIMAIFQNKWPVKEKFKMEMLVRSK